MDNFYEDFIVAILLALGTVVLFMLISGAICDHQKTSLLTPECVKKFGEDWEYRDGGRYETGYCVSAEGVRKYL